MKRFAKLAAVVLVTILAVPAGVELCARSVKQHRDELRSKVRGSLAYLLAPNISDEVAWIHVKGGNFVIIGIRKRGKLELLTNSAAWACGSERDFECHVWAVEDWIDPETWRPGDPGTICLATQDYEGLEEFKCRGK